jgi:hypothetical protein
MRNIVTFIPVTEFVSTKHKYETSVDRIVERLILALAFRVMNLHLLLLLSFRMLVPISSFGLDEH